MKGHETMTNTNTKVHRTITERDYRMVANRTLYNTRTTSTVSGWRYNPAVVSVLFILVMVVAVWLDK